MSEQLKLDLDLPENVITVDIFNKLLDDITIDMKNTLGRKADEYATADRMHNFKVAGLHLDTTPEKALLGFVMKHWISMLDMLNDIEKGKKTPSFEYVREKLGDIRNYMVLLEALLLERRYCEGDIFLRENNFLQDK